MGNATNKGIARAKGETTLQSVSKTGERQFRTDISERTFDAFVKECERLGILQKIATERLMANWLALDPDVRVMFLELLTPSRRAKLARLLLRELGRP